MDSDKNVDELHNKGKPKNAEKGSFIRNGKICKKGKYPKLWKRYLGLKSVLCLQKDINNEESVYNLRYLFESPSQISEYICGSSHQSLKIKMHDAQLLNQLDTMNKTEKGQCSNIELRIVSDAFKQPESNPSTSLNETEHALNTSKVIHVSSSSLPSCDELPSSAGLSNHSVKVKIHSLQSPHQVKGLDIFKSNSPNILVIHGSEVFEIGDDDDSDNFPKCNRSKSQICLTDSLKNVSKPSSVCETSKSLTGLTNEINSSQTCKISEENSSPNCNLKIYYLPQTEIHQTENKVNCKLDNCATVKGISTSEDYLPKMDHIIENISYPSINLKIYNTTVPQVEKSGEDLKTHIQDASHFLENVKSDMQNIVKQTETNANKNERKEFFSKDFTQNIIEIGKDMMQSIQGVIFKTYSNSCSGIDLCESDSRFENDEKPCSSAPIKLNTHNETQHYFSKNQQTTSGSFNNGAIRKESFKRDAGHKSKSLKNLNESVQTDAEQSRTLLSSPSGSKRTPQFLTLRQRQMELHQLRVRVEKKRLEMLDLKLAREWEEMKREKIIFEKLFSPTQIQLDMTDDLVEI